MEFRADFKSNIAEKAREDAAEVKRLRSELTAAGGAMGGMAKAGASIGQNAVGSRSPWAGPLRVNQQVPDIYRAVGAYKAEQQAAEKAKKAKDSLAKTAAEKAASGAGTMAGGAKMALGAAGGAAGVMGLAGLGKLALGYQGMARLQALGFRTQIQMRQIFSGVDSSPATRAADRFLNSIFSKGSATGKALEGLFGRTATSLFGGLEKAQPYVTAFFQGMVLAGLYIENAALRVRLATLPMTLAIEDTIGPTNGMKIAAAGGAVALIALTGAATGAAAPFVAAGAAVSFLVAQIQQLKAEWDGDALRKQVRKDFSFGFIDDDKAKGPGEGESAGGRSRAEVDAINRERRLAMVSEGGGKEQESAGSSSGRMYAAGVEKGLDAGADAAARAGGRLAKKVDTGFRNEAEIRSPSRKAEETASYIPQGTVRGLDKGAASVQAAAERLSPKMPGASAGGPSSGTPSASIVIHNHFPELKSGDRGSIEAALDAAFERGVRHVAQALGIPVQIGATA